MNCNEATERLPWLLNGTLGEDERRQVMAHLKDCAACRTALRETREAWRIYDQHIPAEDLVAHAWGEAPVTVDPGLLEEHLASCPRCAAELELVRMSRRLEEDDRIAVMPARRQAPAPAGERRSGFWRAAALAASLAAVAGLGGWVYNVDRVQSLETRLAETQARPAQPSRPVPPASPAPNPNTTADQLARLQTEIERLEQSQQEVQRQAREAQEQLALLERERGRTAEPQLNTVVLEMMAFTTRGEEPEAPDTVPLSTSAVTLALSAGDVPSYPDYGVEVRDARGRTVWNGKGLKWDGGNGRFALPLPRGFLAPGSYTIEIFGLDGERRTSVGKGPIRVR